MEASRASIFLFHFLALRTCDLACPYMFGCGLPDDFIHLTNRHAFLFVGIQREVAERGRVAGRWTAAGYASCFTALFPPR